LTEYSDQPQIPRNSGHPQVKWGNLSCVRPMINIIIVFPCPGVKFNRYFVVPHLTSYPDLEHKQVVEMPGSRLEFLNTSRAALALNEINVTRKASNLSFVLLLDLHPSHVLAQNTTQQKS
jgi:hypothetical protein